MHPHFYSYPPPLPGKPILKTIPHVKKDGGGSNCEDIKQTISDSVLVLLHSCRVVGWNLALTWWLFKSRNETESQIDLAIIKIALKLT